MAPGLTSIYGITIEAPPRTKCHFFRIPPGELLTLLTICLKSDIDHGLQRSACIYMAISSKSRCCLESHASYNSREKSASEFGRELEKKAQERENKSGWNTAVQGRMIAAILRTNRAIYFEAAPLLYTETTVGPQTCDLVCLSEGSSARDNVQGRPKVWRHSPLRGKGYRNAKGVQVYASDEMNGDMEPYVFARA